MDLVAYLNIADLEAVAQKNGISVPRLRGYSLMSDEQSVSQEEIGRVLNVICGNIYEKACTSVPRFRPDSDMAEFSSATDRLRKKYLITDKEMWEADGETFSYDKVVGIRWDLIHGKNRKAIKFAIKKAKRNVIEYYRVFNKYAGRQDILRVHARIGGGNWPYYYREVVGEPWFLEKIDDYADNTYCDIFAKLQSK